MGPRRRRDALRAPGGRRPQLRLPRVHPRADRQHGQQHLRADGQPPGRRQVLARARQERIQRGLRVGDLAVRQPRGRRAAAGVPGRQRDPLPAVATSAADLVDLPRRDVLHRRGRRRRRLRRRVDLHDRLDVTRRARSAARRHDRQPGRLLLARDGQQGLRTQLVPQPGLALRHRAAAGPRHHGSALEPELRAPGRRARLGARGRRQVLRGRGRAEPGLHQHPADGDRHPGHALLASGVLRQRPVLLARAGS